MKRVCHQFPWRTHCKNLELVRVGIFQFEEVSMDVFQLLNTWPHMLHNQEGTEVSIDNYKINKL